MSLRRGKVKQKLETKVFDLCHGPAGKRGSSRLNRTLIRRVNFRRQAAPLRPRVISGGEMFEPRLPGRHFSTSDSSIFIPKWRPPSSK